MVIDLTRSEKATFFRFLGLYLGSSLILMLFVAFFYFQQEKRLYYDLTKSKMQNIVAEISSEIIISHMQAYSFNSEKYLNSEKYKGSFAINRKNYLENKNYKIAFYDENRKLLFGSFKGKIDFSKKVFLEDNNIVLLDNSPVGHLGIGYIVIKDISLKIKISKLKTNIFLIALVIYLIIGIIGFYLAKLFLRPIKEERKKLNRFLKDTTHELNTPISAILMSSEDENINEKQKERIRLSAKRISEIYKDLTYIFLQDKKEIQNIKLYDLKLLLEEQLDYFKPLISKKRINLDLQIESFFYEIYKDDFIRLINNLISNGIKYNKINGKLQIIIKKDFIKIKNSGIIIEEKKQKDVFKRYVRATQEQGGFGIGLSIVNAICEKYKIKIELKSQETQGTSFSLYF